MCVTLQMISVHGMQERVFLSGKLEPHFLKGFLVSRFAKKKVKSLNIPHRN